MGEMAEFDLFRSMPPGLSDSPRYHAKWGAPPGTILQLPAPPARAA